MSSLTKDGSGADERTGTDGTPARDANHAAWALTMLVRRLAVPWQPATELHRDNLVIHLDASELLGIARWPSAVQNVGPAASCNGPRHAGLDSTIAATVTGAVKIDQPPQRRLLLPNMEPTQLISTGNHVRRCQASLRSVFSTAN